MSHPFRCPVLATRRLATLLLATLLLAGLPAVVGSRALGDDGQGVKLRLKAYFNAKDDDSKKTALDALSSEPVPADLDRRVRLLRDAFGTTPRKAFTRSSEKLALPAGGEVETFFATPRRFDEKKTYAGFVSLFGHGDSANLWSFAPFTLPPEVIADLQKLLDEECAKRGLPKGNVKQKLSVPWEDGLVIAPSFYEANAGAEHATLDHVEADVLAALEKGNRAYALDSDRVTLGGLSLGAAFGYEVACRHPDRFAAVVAMSGGSPGWPLENLRPLQVYISHGAKDDDVPVRVGREMDARLKECGVTHVYKELPNLGHKWPEPGADGAAIRTWMKARTRTPWPRELHQTFDGSARAGRVFWVEVDQGQQATVDATAKDNAITLTVRGARSVVLHLGEPLVDLEKEVVVSWNTTEVFRGKIERSWKNLLADLEGDGFDWPRAAPGRLEVKAP